MAKASKAYGVEPGHPPYRLRQARYPALAEDVAQFARQLHDREGRRVDLLDVGVGDGVSRRYIEIHPGSENIDFHAADRYPHGLAGVYKNQLWQHHPMDAEEGLPQLESNRYDIVICEQVLERLHNTEHAMSELSRVLRPGGLLVVGVPIFPHGLHLIRKHLVPICDRLVNRRPRPHVQAFSKRKFLKLLTRKCDIDVRTTRGFRIVSGGLLRPLEYCRWWWQLNRRVGSVLPSLCVEIQVVATKRDAVPPSACHEAPARRREAPARRREAPARRAA